MLLIDYGQSNSGLNIFPSKPLLANQKDSDSSIKIEHYQLPAHQAPKHIPLQNAVVIFHQPITRVRRRLGEKCQIERIKTGDIVVSPADVLHCARWEEPANFTLLLLERDFLTRAAYEFKHSDRVELLPTFARPDPVVYQIGLALKTEVQRDFGLGGKDFSQRRSSQKIYLDTAASFLAAHLLRYYSATGSSIDRRACCPIEI